MNFPNPLALLLLLLPTPTIQDAAPLEVATTIRDVTVYPAEALVTRAGNASVQRGVTRIEVRALPAALRDDTIRVKAGTGANVVGVDVIAVPAPTSPSPAVEALRQKRLGLERERQRAADQLEILKGQRAYLDSIRAEAPKIFGQGSLGSAVEPAKWKDAVEFLTASFSANVEGTRKLQERDAQLQAELVALDEQLGKLQAGRLVPTKTLAIDLLADAVGAAPFELSYLIGNASWGATYDVRVAQDLKSAQLLLVAVATQRTGEDWSGVNLTFSTAKPERGAQPPKPIPRFLAAVEERGRGYASAKKLATTGRVQLREDLKAGADADVDKERAEASDLAGILAPSAPPLPVDAQVASSGLATQLRVPRPENLPADGRPHRVRVAEVALPLEPIHVAVPRLASRAFVQAKPKNTAAFPILAGPAQVFVGNDFVGKVQVEETPVGEAIVLALGADPGITVERKQEKADREGPGFLGSRVRWTYRYRITVKNTGAATGPALVEVAETIPVSRDDRIRVEVESSEPAFLRGAQHDRDRETQGILRWSLALAPGEEKVVALTYVVSAPEDVAVDGLEPLK